MNTFLKWLDEKVVSIYLYQNLKCNANCLFCTIWTDNFNIKTQYDIEYWNDQSIETFFQKYILPFRDTKAKLQFKFLGWEPFLQISYILWILNCLKKYDFQDKIDYISINTNAILLENFLIKYFPTDIIQYFAGKYFFICSVHGVWRVHDELMGVESFQKILRGLLMLHKLWLNFSINYVVTKLNIYHITFFLDYMGKIFGTKIAVNFWFIDAVWNGYDNKSKLLIDFRDEKIIQLFQDVFPSYFSRFQNIEFSWVVPYCLIPEEKICKKLQDYYVMMPWMVTYIFLQVEKQSADEYYAELKKINPDAKFYTNTNYWKENTTFLYEACKGCKWIDECMIYQKRWYQDLHIYAHGIEVEGQDYTSYLRS